MKLNPIYRQGAPNHSGSLRLDSEDNQTNDARRSQIVIQRQNLKMSVENLGKKTVEESDLSHFLSAYNAITDQPLTYSSGGESPDFICVRASGNLVGVELTRSPHDFESAVHDRIWTDGAMDSFDLLDAINGILAAKERKRKASFWRTPDNTILVIQLLNYSFDSLAWTDDKSLQSDFSESGFVEIWIADHSTLKAFGEVRLIGLYPSRIWGLHAQPALQRKPYG